MICIKIETDSNLIVNIFFMQGCGNSKKWSKQKHDTNNRKFSRNEPTHRKAEQMFQGSVMCINATALK